ncbi:MAG: hypothetical protein Q9221_009158 [Calogaya cf. arnoldii]
MTKLTWLVTGCSSGFGKQFVHSILARGDNVIATGRKADQRLAHLKDTGAAILDLDISASEEQIAAKAQEALKIYDGIDVLVNNAGYIDFGFVEDFPYDRWLAQFKTNFFGAVALTRALLPHMHSKRSGTIVNNGSVVGWQSLPGAPGYNATKYALEAYTENLQLELAPFNIRSIIFEPGHFRTPIISTSKRTEDLSSHPDYAPALGMLRATLAGNDDNQPGDPKKGVEMMIDVIKGEGAAKGKAMPARLPLGTDCLEVVRKKCLETLKICDEWEEAIRSTDFPAEIKSYRFGGVEVRVE